MPLQTIRTWLGHANIAQTSTYLASTQQGSQDAMREFERKRALQEMANGPGNSRNQQPSTAEMTDEQPQESGAILH